MIENGFVEQIKHSICDAGQIEQSDCTAFIIDGDNGLAEYLGFSNRTLCKVDYFSKNGNSIQLIELTDLENAVQQCCLNLNEEIIQAERVKGSRLTTNEARFIRKKVWSPVMNEFKRKWNGSIAIVERLYRKNQVKDIDPSYQLLIVCKDRTDIRILDILKDRLKGMMDVVKVCNTSNVSDQLISNNQ